MSAQLHAYTLTCSSCGTALLHTASVVPLEQPSDRVVQARTRVDHPGRVLLQTIRRRGLGFGEMAGQLGVAASSLSRVMHGKYLISLELALALEQAGLETAEYWLTLQVRHQVAQARLASMR